MLTFLELFRVKHRAKGCRHIVFNSHKTPSHIHLFIKKYLLNIFYVLDTVLGASGYRDNIIVVPVPGEHTVE